MGSAANCVLPLRNTCEGVANPGRLHGGVPMTAHATGFRPTRPHLDSEMDVAWQELMAITELQEFEAPSESPYEAIPYLSMENMASLGNFGVNPPLAEPHVHIGNGHPSAAVYESHYPDVMPPCQRLNPNSEMHYGHPGAQLSSRLLPNAQSLQLQPPVMSLLEHINLGYANRSLGKDSMGHPTGPQHTKHHTNTDDLESDSGLSLGSSPPLASPENAVHGVGPYLHTETVQGYSEAEMEGVAEQGQMRGNLLYSLDYQPSYIYPGPASSYYPVASNLPMQQPPPQQPMVSLKQHQVPPPALHDLHMNGSSKLGAQAGQYQAPYMKPRLGGGPPSLSRDERRALALKIPLPLDKIVNLPVDDFNELLTQYAMSDAQLALVRDIRRRGKNKVAAQNCRKRKLENILHLEGELGKLKAQREHLARERLEFQRNLALIKCRLSDLYTKVFSQLRDEDGHPYSLEDFSLQQTNDGNIYLVPRTAALEGE